MKNSNSFQYLVIGSGRTARHMIRYLQLLDLPFQTWNRGSQAENSASHLKDLAQKATHILLAISDSEIENFYQKNLKPFSAAQIIHFSGARVIPGLIDAHPLMSFSQDLYPLETYRSLAFVTCSDEKEILPGLKNHFYQISAEEKPLYHALCVASGNFTTLLWQKMKQGLEEMGIPFSAAHPYLLQITKNLLTAPDLALTGPIARKDLTTVKLNDQALNGDAFQNIYRAFVSTYYPEAYLKDQI